jgi:predicted DNA-binding transcriptional regulator YafY
MDVLIDDPNTFAKNLLSGKYDAIIWNLELNNLSDEENIILSLSQMENSALASIGSTPVTLKRSALFEKKDSIKPISYKIRKIQATIQDAIETGSAISFTYTPRDGKEQIIKCLPQRLITNVTDNWIYLMHTSSPYPFRLDRIKHFHGIISDDGSYPAPESNQNEKYYWGTTGDAAQKPVHVKLRIAAETRNIISKIKSDISFRSETCKFYQMNNFYYYEDDIIGMDEFQRWVRGYGSSIIVIEPTSLKNNIVKRAKETLELYEASESWGDI